MYNNASMHALIVMSVWLPTKQKQGNGVHITLYSMQTNDDMI
jgi:hypothetical protein